jgi:hypothetical protein
MEGRSIIRTERKPLGCEGRSVERLPLELPATMTKSRHGLELPLEVVLIDISGKGCRLRAADPPNVGTFIVLHIPDFTEVSGWVAWRHTDQLGVDFANAIPAAVVRHLISLAGKISS